LESQGFDLDYFHDYGGGAKLRYHQLRKMKSINLVGKKEECWILTNTDTKTEIRRWPTMGLVLNSKIILWCYNHVLREMGLFSKPGIPVPKPPVPLSADIELA
jgi:hypothetical protein